MKMRDLAILISAWLLSAHVGTAETPHEAELAIMKNESALGQAMIDHDVKRLSELVDERWTMQSSSGSVGTRQAFLDDVKSGKLVVKTFRLHDVHIRVLGHMAYVMASDDEESSYEGESHSGTYNWMDVWELRRGRWVSVATQLTEVKAAGTR